MDEEKSIPKRRFILLYAFSVLLGLLCIFIVNSKEHKQSNYEVVGTFYIIIIISFINLIHSIRNNSFSLNIMFWIFNLFFFGVAPLLQYSNNVYSWNLTPRESEIIKTNWLIIIWLISYLIGRILVVDSDKKETQSKCKMEIIEERLNCLLLFSILITLYNILYIGFNNLMFRSTNQNGDLSKMGGLIIGQGFHNIVLFSFVFFILKYRLNNKEKDIKFYIMAVCYIISCFPTGIARNMMASFYLGLFIIVIDKNRESRWNSALLIVGLVLVFPAINIFRSTNLLENENLIEIIISRIQSDYISGNYDAHQMFISIQRAGNITGLSYGKQLIGAILFFVPRAIWAGKPYGTGQTAFELTNQFWFTNVSAPLVSEFWINFGVIGILVFGSALGYVIKRIDRAYWQSETQLQFIRVIYPFSLTMFFFIQRGDLQSTWSYTFAQIVIALVVYKFCVCKTDIQNND